MLFNSYVKDLNRLKQQLHTRKGAQQQLVTERVNHMDRVLLMNDELLIQQSTQILLQRVSDTARVHGKKRLEDIVTNALQFVFGPEVRFEIELYEQAGRPQAEFYLVTSTTGEDVRTRPVDDNGGGVVDIISLALRIAVLQIHHDPKIGGPIILDEPGKHVSEDYAERMATFLQQMSQHFGRQIIMVTHQPYLAQAADTAFDVQVIGGKSVVTPA